MPRRLSGLDAAFIYMETATAHMHVGAVLILDPADVPPAQLTYDAFVDYVQRRLHLAPPLRRRLVQVPFRLDHPHWIEDPNFDVRFHVRRAALPAPGGMTELAELVGDVMARQLDRSRPLWELYVVEGLEDGRRALVTKAHHAAVDGISGMEMTSAIMQLAPDQEPVEPVRDWQPESEPSDLRLLWSAGRHLAISPVGVMRLGRRLVAAGADVLKLQLGTTTSDEAPSNQPPPAPFAAPMTALNGSIGPHRRVSLTELPLDGVKSIKTALGGTVNDVVLAAVSGALRTFLRHRGEPLDRPLVAMVPISVRTDEQRGQTGNQVSAMLTALPVHLADPLERLRGVSRGTRGAKEQFGALGADTIAQLAELTPAGVATLAARLYTRTRAADRHRPIWNVVVSNVPGPRIPLYANGARIEAIYPIGPIHEMCGLNVTLFSYLDTIFVGVNADRDLVPDVDVFSGALRDAVDELAKAAAANS
jgi:diacylglycerol O-acyltransferase / wax synthase